MVNSQSKKGKFTENIQKEEIKEEKLHTSGSITFMFIYWTHFMGLTPQNVNFLDDPPPSKCLVRTGWNIPVVSNIFFAQSTCVAEV